MRGATDGGAHIEAMRTEHMHRGRCALCHKYERHIERHHEKYRPEHVIPLCHHCHHRVHFRPYHLSDAEKEKLLTRHGDERYKAFSRKPRLFIQMKRLYVAPGRRPAQMKVRAEVRRRYKDSTKNSQS